MDKRGHCCVGLKSSLPATSEPAGHTSFLLSRDVGVSEVFNVSSNLGQHVRRNGY
jgi:hypothetical protein